MDVDLADRLEIAGVGQRPGFDGLEIALGDDVGDNFLGGLVIAGNEDLHGAALASIRREQLREDCVVRLNGLGLRSEPLDFLCR